MDDPGTLLFRWRNLLFPALVLGLLAAFPVRPLGPPWRLAAGLALVAAGQGLRVLTIGLDYVRRGGSKGRFFAPGLVTGGLFGHCRNPMYCGNLLLVAGTFTLTGNWAGLLAAVTLFALAYSAIVRGEERYLAGRFGEGYDAYRRAVPRWLPRLAGLGSTLRAHRFDWRRVVAKEYGTLATTLFTSLLVWALADAAAHGWDTVARRPIPYAAVAASGSAAWATARYLKKTHRLRKAATAA
ncbi:MAG: methyltransferase family protein [Planctomycetaceae bacterium]